MIADLGAQDLSLPIGAVETAGEIDLYPGRKRLTLEIANTSARVVRVSSHYPLDLVNPRLHLDRDAAGGHHLAIPAGATLRWLPGETRVVEAVAIGPLS